MAETWTIQRVLDWTVGYLERKGDERPRLSAEWLLAFVTGLSRVELYVNFDRPLEPDELARMHEAVARRGRGEPLQYVTGEMPFRHLILRCEEGVLIPRPETEVLVDVALACMDTSLAEGHAWDDVRQRSAQRSATDRAAREARADELRAALMPTEDGLLDERQVDELLHELAQLQTKAAVAPLGARVLDLCTGTGCIALSLASERRGTHVVATDLAPKAVSLATRNRDALGLTDAVDVLECDLAEGVSEELIGTFDVLVSNPPYIPTAVLERDVPPEVRDHEPHLALDGGPDGLDLFRRIAELAPHALRAGGWMALELSEDNVEQAAHELHAAGIWDHIEVIPDLTQRPRVLRAHRAS